MTRKDYNLIARAVNTLNITPAVFDLCDGDSDKIAAVEQAVRVQVARNLAHFLAGDNHRFDSERFVEACGVND